MTIEILGFSDQFTLNTAFELLNCHVVKKGDEEKAKSTIEVIGFVAGIITLNDEIEIMIKFPKELVQLTKTAFAEQITLLEMP